MGGREGGEMCVQLGAFNTHCTRVHVYWKGKESVNK